MPCLGLCVPRGVRSTTEVSVQVSWPPNNQVSALGKVYAALSCYVHRLMASHSRVCYWVNVVFRSLFSNNKFTITIRLFL